MNLKLIVVYILTVISTVAFAQENKMTASEIAVLKKNIASHAVVKSLTADFTQHKKVGYVKEEIISSGKFYLKHPNKLAWYYTSPTAYKMIFNDRKILIEDKGKTKVLDLGRSKQFEKISQAIQFNLGEGSFDSADFKATYYQTPTAYLVKLDPLGKDVKKGFKQLVLTLDKATYRIVEINIIEPSGGYAKFKLENHKVNTTIDDKLFVL